jgi:hypothetical protein
MVVGSCQRQVILLWFCQHVGASVGWRRGLEEWLLYDKLNSDYVLIRKFPAWECDLNC